MLVASHKDLLSKLCSEDQPEKFSLWGYCVVPLFENVLPRNGDYNLRHFDKQPESEYFLEPWDTSKWALQFGAEEEQESSKLNYLSVNFSLSSQLLMNEGLLLIWFPSGLTNLGAIDIFSICLQITL